MIKGIIFDYDGTIGDSLGRQEAWFKHWGQVNNVPWKFSNYHEFRESYNSILAKQGPQAWYDFLGLPCDMHDRSHPVWAAYDKYKADYLIPAFPGIKAAIAEIERLGRLTETVDRTTRLRLGLNTSNSWKSVYSDLDRFNILPYFDSFVTEEILRKEGDGTKTLYKPHPFSVELALKKMDTSKEETIHVGDTLEDLCAARGLLNIGVSYGYNGRDTLEQGVEIEPGKRIYFDKIVDHPHQLADAVRELMAR